MTFRDIEVEEQYRDEWDKFKMWDLKMKNTEETFRVFRVFRGLTLTSRARFPERLRVAATTLEPEERQDQ